MFETWAVVVAGVAYLGLLFAIAYYGSRRADRGRSVISNGYVYALSMAVYATSWAFYGNVGRAASDGVGFLPLYLGPTIMAALWWLVLRKIIRISRRHRITSLADFVSSRYGKSGFLGGLVTVIAVVGIVPAIALQLKAISVTFSILRGDPALVTAAAIPGVPVLHDTALYAALLLAAFTIVFGTRHLDASERHEGMVAAIAFGSLVKLVAFFAAGCYVTFVLFHGFGDMFSKAAARADITKLFNYGTSYGSWLWLVVLSMLAILLLPRQWQVGVVENVDERHIKKAMWVFPLYLLLINFFVLPIAVGGLLTLGHGANADFFVLTLPISQQQPGLALLVFIGGVSASTGMVIVETIALSTMVSNSLVVPLLLHRGEALTRRWDLGAVILGVRRVTIVLVLLFGFVYFRVAGGPVTLVSIGLISFAAVAQFAPAVLGGLFWKGATKRGAVGGLTAGFVLWAYTLLLPSIGEAGWLPASFINDGPFGVRILAPYSLMGLDGLDHISHAMTWTMLVNVGLFVGLSLTGSRTPAEHVQAAEFVDIFESPGDGTHSTHGTFWRGTVTVGELVGLLERFLGPDRARESLTTYAAHTSVDISASADASPDLMHHVETTLVGAFGSASARFMVASVVDEDLLAVSQVMDILAETSQVLAYSRALELASATDDLTGLPNRRALYAEGVARLGGAQRTRQALLMLDLNKFKEVNDSLGHHVGDLLLIQVGSRLLEQLREGDALARLGGDEFAIFLEDAGHDEAAEVAVKLRTALAEPFELDGLTLDISVSVGISLFPGDGPDLSVLLRKADIAMYKAKSSGQGHHLYRAADDADEVTRLQTVAELRTALTSDELVVHYQPKVNLRTGEVHSVEALVRWDHPTRGLLYPAAFLNLVEESRLMPTLTRVVLTLALDQAASWKAAAKPLTISVNLSASSLVDTDLPEQVALMLAVRGLLPSALQLEITEDFLVADRDLARSILTRLRDCGVQISVDDFGTGYSSLAYLRDLPVDELKLDRSFIFPMADDARAAALVASTITLAHSLGLRMVAEGVETEVAYTELARLGCDEAQGYFISRPVPAAELDYWLTTRHIILPQTMPGIS
ncbi:MAG: hypothetical protein QOE58_3282 [Actinomycetota bacterium]|nr:hypothetical protein [Actinomycetota bacterium]